MHCLVGMEQMDSNGWTLAYQRENYSQVTLFVLKLLTFLSAKVFITMLIITVLTTALEKSGKKELMRSISVRQRKSLKCSKNAL